jgi:hypothetical protein
VAVVALAALAGPAQASDNDGSNWAGYVASAAKVRFTNVSATWVEPAVSCRPGSPTYMSNWVGLGGDSTPVLEQIGTEADCGADGQATYSSWYELVPTVSASPDLEVRPGDVISASVTVSGRTVDLRMSNQTLGVVFARRLTASSVDVSSAEWIVEAPAVCASAAAASCHKSVLSSFGSTGFSGISATAAGHRGALVDRHWSATAYALAVGPGPTRARSAQRSGAVPGALTGSGAAFSIRVAATRPHDALT